LELDHSDFGFDEYKAGFDIEDTVLGNRVRNILAVYDDASPSEKEEGLGWYRRELRPRVTFPSVRRVVSLPPFRHKYPGTGTRSLRVRSSRPVRALVKPVRTSTRRSGSSRATGPA
jgi:hypothetical protein